MDHKPPRILIGLIILGLIITLCAYYASENENHLEYPSYGTILSDYPDGELVQVDGTVVKTYTSGYELRKIYQDQIVTMKVNSTSPVDVGDRVKLVGVLGPVYTVTKVQKIYVDQLWKYQFILLRSLLVLILMIFLFFRYWTFKKLEFRRR